MRKVLQALFVALTALGALVAAPKAAKAALVDEPVPENAYITIGGYDIAWASPCAPAEPTCGALDLSYQSQFGWEVMSTDLFNELGITAESFLKEGGNVDYATGNNLDEATGIYATSFWAGEPGGDLALAIAYFSPTYYHADWSDGLTGRFAPISSSSIADTLVVRLSSSVGESAKSVPELGASGLAAALTLLTGSGVLLTDRRRKLSA